MIQTARHQSLDVSLRLVAHATPIGVLLSGARSYQVPDDRRRYSWTAENARDLWDDVRMAADEKEHHFFGTLLAVDATEPGRPAQVIDGQQRLTTFALLLIAIDRDSNGPKKVGTAASWNARAIEEREAELLDAATAHFCRPLGQRATPSS